MTRIILHGCCGRMGQMITQIAVQDPSCEIVAGVDARGGESDSYPVYRTLAECREEADALIDFSTAAAVYGLLAWCGERQMPCVLCTTGLSPEQEAVMREMAERVAILKSANMSLGINLFFKVLQEAAAKLSAAGFDMEIVEKHHSQKLDAPSGTALALADVINEAAGGDYEYVYDRSTRRQKRPEKEIGISAVRGGTIVGDHDVIFAGEDEVITFSHRAYSRAVFAKGAVEAAKFLAGKGPGLYTMSDVIG
ncbi:MAG: 4-hydroxy-tetrahydrodipicolinate reductase [Eubacteriales bacterium]|nr:4-hydroxy-tetrahydrodipicolinate reductase [Eubacteriales bacterium]